MGGMTRGVTLEVPWKLLRKVLPWRSLGRCDEGCYLRGPLVVVTRGGYLGGPLGGVTRGVTLEIPLKVLRGVLPWSSVGKYYEGCYLQVPWEVLPWRSLGRCNEDDSCGDQTHHNKNDENGNEDACKRGGQFRPVFTSILMFLLNLLKIGDSFSNCLFFYNFLLKAISSFLSNIVKNQ